jgi:hypothetical protein
VPSRIITKSMSEYLFSSPLVRDPKYQILTNESQKTSWIIAITSGFIGEEFGFSGKDGLIGRTKILIYKIYIFLLCQ